MYSQRYYMFESVEEGTTGIVQVPKALNPKTMKSTSLKPEEGEVGEG